ncbi:isochorismatase domain-containing protein 1-like isoform X1 [Haliotis rubra]|uniref:isochorismatase domain-containing protein 1-like isoform X1 n=1 Tax=Haliotis rubra TaxID=36100 RepID=UPI001EE50FF5|nr:isochorismatase domain-containing protein 1-like isoform X1 [Haliotis rubra]XP_046575026.1 isochorismatase domain-containing protein 1-like isoform X1 [Haliotis rubra]
MSERRLGDLRLDQTVFFCCDMQEKFRPAIKHFSDILQIAQRLVKASKILNIPLIVTEQYPKGLGATVSELDVAHAVEVFPKTRFTMLLPEVEQKLQSLPNIKHVVLFGIETHVCIQQTVIDLLKKDYEVHVIADACSSRSQMNRLFALERFRQSGAIVTTSEAVLLQLVGDKEHPNFKEIQSLIKELGPESGLGCNL